MPVDTKTAQGRRDLRFASLDEMVADAERLVVSPDTRMLGNWSLGHLLAHLTVGINGSIDGYPAKAPLIARLLGPLIKRRFLTKPMPSGFKLPKGEEAALYPAAGSAQEALQGLGMAVGRLKTERMTARHPVFGKMTHEEWTQLHLRHAELHLSFADPGNFNPRVSGAPSNPSDH